MSLFRKKPVMISAEQYWEENFTSVHRDPNIPGLCWDTNHIDSGYVPHVDTLEGPLKVTTGDWIIKGTQGEFYPCKPDIFEAVYDPVEEIDTQDDVQS